VASFCPDSPGVCGAAIATAQDMSYQVLAGLEGDVAGIPHFLTIGFLRRELFELSESMGTGFPSRPGKSSRFSGFQGRKIGLYGKPNGHYSWHTADCP